MPLPPARSLPEPAPARPPRRPRAAGRALGALLPLLLLAAGCRSGADDPLARLREHLPRRPGVPIIVLTFDALRADVLGAYGHARPTSPHIDRFAEEALVFEQAYTAAPVSPTSFASAWTGMLATRVFHGWQLVTPDTLAQAFQDGGYRTAAFINNVQITPERGFHQGWELYDFHRNDPDEVVLAAGLEWLREHRDEPVLVWIHLLTPHAPYVEREMARHLYTPGYEGPFEKTTGTLFEIEDERDLRRAFELYEGNVLYADSLFATFRRELEAMGLWERAVVALSSDHGEEFHDHGGVQHGKLYEEHVRIPLIVRHPDAPGGARSDVLVSNLDLMPTLLAVAGLPRLRPLDGRDLTALEQAPRTLLGVSITSGSYRLLSLRHGDHKLIETCVPERGQELYDLARDPAERDSLAAQEPERAAALLAEMTTILGGDPCAVQAAAVQGVAPTVGLDERSIEALRALGYLQDEPPADAAR